MSPTARFSSVLDGHDGCVLGRVGRGVPGVVGTGWYREGAIPGTTQDPPRHPYLTLI